MINWFYKNRLFLLTIILFLFLVCFFIKLKIYLLEFLYLLSFFILILLIAILNQKILSKLDRYCFEIIKKNKTVLRNPTLPINSEREDRLSFSNKLDEIINFIESNNYNHGRILIEGEWGTGKTSLINLLKERLIQNRNSFEIIEFNVWNFHNFDQVLYSVIKDISKKFKYPFYKQILKPLRVHLKSSFIETTLELDNDLSFSEKVEDFQNFIASELEYNNKKLIIIFDDLDRVPDEKIIINTLMLINLLLRIPNVFIVEAIDEENIYSIVKDRKRVVGYNFKSADLIIRLENRNMNEFIKNKIFEEIIPIIFENENQ